MNVSAVAANIQVVGANGVPEMPSGTLPLEMSMAEPAASMPMSMEALMVMQQKLQGLDLKGSEEKLAKKSQLRKEKLDKAIAEYRKALEEQAKKGGGFFGRLLDDLGPMVKVAAVVSSVALAVGTAGAAAPVAYLAIAGAVMSTAGYVQGQFHVLEKLGVDKETAGYMGLGMSFAGAGCSVGASLMAGAQAAQAAGAAEDAQAVESGAESTMKTVDNVIQVAEGIDAAGRGVITYIDAGHQEKADKAMAKATLYNMQRDWLTMEIMRTLDDVKTSQKKAQQTIKTIMGTIQMRDETPAIVAAKVRA